MRKIHELKTWPRFFQASKIGLKNFEYRLNDRDFNVGDELVLKEWNPVAQEYTGDQLQFKIAQVWNSLPGMPCDHVILMLVPG